MKSFYFHDENILFLLSSAHWKIHSNLKKRFIEENYSVTPDQWLILLNLSNDGPVYQNHLAKSQFKDKAAIKRLLDHLEEKKLIKRKNSQQDLRKKEVHLTQKGSELVIILNEMAKKTFRDASKELTETELNALKRLIRKIEGYKS